MQTFTFITSILVAATAVAAQEPIQFIWSRCTNVPRCVSRASPAPDTPQNPGAILYYPGVSLASAQDYSRYSYTGDNGYWYSHDVDGSFVSPEGYLRFASGFGMVGVASKDISIGTTYWVNGGEDCCLPDNVGTGIQDLLAYST